MGDTSREETIQVSKHERKEGRKHTALNNVPRSFTQASVVAGVPSEWLHCVCFSQILRGASDPHLDPRTHPGTRSQPAPMAMVTPLLWRRFKVPLAVHFCETFISIDPPQCRNYNFALREYTPISIPPGMQPDKGPKQKLRRCVLYPPFRFL